MAELSAAEQQMFAKWRGVEDLHLSDDFWADVLVVYQEKHVPIPLEYTPQSARRVLDMLECPPGKCGLCCRYGELPVDSFDVQRIVQKTDWTTEGLGALLKAKPDGSVVIPCPSGCPFLEDNRCTIYDARPSVCFFFPLQSPRMAMRNGQAFHQAVLRIKCPSTVNIVRTLMCEALVNGGILLPDLSLVAPYKAEEES